MSRARRTNPEIRREHIVNAAVQLSIEIGYKCITRDAVAHTANISSPLVGTYFPRMRDLKKAVVKKAIENEVLEVLAQGLTLNDDAMSKISDSLKKKVLAYLAKIT